MIYAGIILIFLYGSVLLVLAIGNWRLKRSVSERPLPTQGFSIVVPFRNEADNLPALLRSISEIDYPNHKFELILVNDQSEDDSVQLISQSLANSPISWKVIENVRKSNSPKKDAITAAVEISAYQWIATTDADCLLPANWLLRFNTLIHKHGPKMVCGPVGIPESEDMVKAFQKFETLSLQGVTKGSFGWKRPLLCNGANLAFSKEVFRELGGYTENNHIASGDDLFLMHKIRSQYANSVVFNNDPTCVVMTMAVKNWDELIAQRIRWASKTSKVGSILLTTIGIIVTLMNLWMIAGLFYFMIWKWDGVAVYLIIYMIKFFMDQVFIEEQVKDAPEKVNLELFFFAYLLYPFITTYIAFRSLFGGYTWKGREFKR
ncbi:MAG: glycosyltransferase [Flavobacterium sp.]|nr:MAG: glycosyltransferase [Flavobacterium sp.]